MISKISWPNTFEKGNPFGGPNGFRPLTLTLYSKSLTNLSDENERTLKILLALSDLGDVQSMSFDGQIYPKIHIKEEESKDGYFDIEIRDSNQNTISWHRGVHKTWLEEISVVRMMNLFGVHNEERFVDARQDLLHLIAHSSLNRDLFVTTSEHIMKNRSNFEDINIRTPFEALKIVSLSMRTKNEFEWISHVEQNIRFLTSRESFYEILTRGLFPNSWVYISALSLHSDKRLVELGWNALSRCAYALQARDEIARLFYLPGTYSTKGLISYHFDYLTLLLIAALDAQALIINIVYGLGLKDVECSLRRNFTKKIKGNDRTRAIGVILDEKSKFIEILFSLRNKIHSASLRENITVPVEYPNELLDEIDKYKPDGLWRVRKEKVNVIRDKNLPVKSFDYSVEKYSLACGLIDESFALIDLLMCEFKS